MFVSPFAVSSATTHGALMLKASGSTQRTSALLGMPKVAKFFLPQFGNFLKWKIC
jgi:predicted glycosyltransferase